MRARHKIIGIVMLMGVLAALLSLPYLWGLFGSVLEEARHELGVSEPLFNALLIGQSALLYGVAALIGGLLYRRAGFRLPFLERLVGGEKSEVNLGRWTLWSLGTGLLVAIVMVAGDYFFYVLGSPLSFAEAELPAWWAGILASISAGIGEELLMRFFFMTLLTLALVNLLRLPPAVGVWAAILLAALLFGLLHLPATRELAELTPLVVTRALLLNGIAGVAFGWLYWRKGLESAITAHIFADALLYGLLPGLI